MIKHLDKNELLIDLLFSKNGKISLKRECGHLLEKDEIIVDERKNSKETIIIGKCQSCTSSSKLRESLANVLVKNNNLLGKYPIVYEKNNTYSHILYDFPFGVEIECYIIPEIIRAISEISDPNVFSTNKRGIKFFFKNTSTNKNHLYNFHFERIKNYIKENKIDINLFLNKFVYGTDGSLRDIGLENSISFEIKTCILKGDKGLEILNHFFNIFQPIFDEMCGMHVHIDPKGSSIPNDYNDIIRYNSSGPLTVNYDLLYPIYSLHIIKKYINKNRLKNNYCRNNYYSAPFNSFRSLLTRNFKRPYDHIESISPSRWNTLEFRMMEGNSDIERIKKLINIYMEFCVVILTSTETELNQLILDALEINELDVQNLDAINTNITRCMNSFVFNEFTDNGQKAIDKFLKEKISKIKKEE